VCVWVGMCGCGSHNALHHDRRGWREHTHGHAFRLSCVGVVQTAHISNLQAEVGQRALVVDMSSRFEELLHRFEGMEKRMARMEAACLVRSMGPTGQLDEPEYVPTPDGNHSPNPIISSVCLRPSTHRSRCGTITQKPTLQCSTHW